MGRYVTNAELKSQGCGVFCLLLMAFCCGGYFYSGRLQKPTEEKKEAAKTEAEEKAEAKVDVAKKENVPLPKLKPEKEEPPPVTTPDRTAFKKDVMGKTRDEVEKQLGTPAGKDNLSTLWEVWIYHDKAHNASNNFKVDRMQKIYFKKGSKVVTDVTFIP